MRLCWCPASKPPTNPSPSAVDPPELDELSSPAVTSHTTTWLRALSLSLLRVSLALPDSLVTDGCLGWRPILGLGLPVLLLLV